MRIDSSTAESAIGLVDAGVPPGDVPVLASMLRAHFAAFEALEALDLSGVEPAARFEAAWDE
ncbi:MAG TPA: hypothetical protein VKV33_01230 [Streptosporangiaceae bacterium]|nr:hypothetical protein [Streptosporangiaceae bacterium]HZV53153.1 hypothetical protein [Candidatus Dormibacteraeota bacterium]